MEVRIDLHCHSRHSRDGIGTIDDIARAARTRGLAGVCITDHDTIRHHRDIHDWNREHASAAFALYPGIEVSTAAGHVLAIGARAAVPAGLDLLETVDRIVAAGGVAVPSHPLRRRIGIRAAGLDAVRERVPAVETWNAQEPVTRNRRMARWADEHGRGMTGGSDAHQVHDVGNGYTILADPQGALDGLLDAVATRRVRAGGRTTPPWTVWRQNLRIARRRVTGYRVDP